MRTLYLSDVVAAVIVIASLFAIGLYGQTQVDPRQIKDPSQVKGFLPVVSVDRKQCVGSGTNTDPTTGNTYMWNCAGLQMIRIVLSNGTILGPYINVPLSDPTIADDPKWQSLPLAAPDPTPAAALPSKR